MSDALHTALADVAAAWLAAPTDEPLIIERDGRGGVIFTRGIMPRRMSQRAAASFLGISYNTFRRQYLDKRLLRLGTDGKVSRRALLRLIDDLD